jgi:hypothetical protein
MQGKIEAIVAERMMRKRMPWDIGEERRRSSSAEISEPPSHDRVFDLCKISASGNSGRRSHFWRGRPASTVRRCQY